ncbi:MAG: ATP-dependent sacrificial sulfur transferase LarE [Planctomycetes bacterium]|nr:ATP-dependent sacrificial sulfur transferase LarE [Planctomycetota bacterium]
MAEPDPRLERLRAEVRKLKGGAVVAFSGGVDSALLLKVCRDELGDAVLAVTADSPSLPAHDRADAANLVAALGVRHSFAPGAEFADERFLRNDARRCYVCKRALFAQLRRLAAANGLAHVVFGANLDDLKDVRPGHEAAREAGARAPLLDARLGKQDVRDLARALGLPCWDRPASACLASRVPHGTPLDPETLARIDRAETQLRALGFRQCRVRHHGRLARVELLVEDIARAAGAERETIARLLREQGYDFVAVDLEGYRAGSLNPR